MKDPITTPGKTYAVTSPNGCTVTTEDGITLAEVEAGKQGYFVAVSGKVLLSDDAAVLTQVFKLAPQQRLALLGVLGGGVPAWFKALETELTALLDGSKFELAWLAGKKTLVVHTDRVDDAMLEAVDAAADAAMPDGVVLAHYNHSVGFSWRNVNPLLPPEQSAKYDSCRNLSEMAEVDPNFRLDLVGDGVWAYPLSSAVNICAMYQVFGSQKNDIKGFQSYLPNLVDIDSAFQLSSVKELELDLPKVTEAGNMCNGCKKLTRVTMNAPSLTWATGTFENCPSLVSFDGNLPKLAGHVSFGLNTFSGCKALYQFNADLPSLKYGKGLFNLCILNKESALRVLNTIPTWNDGASHLLTIGIHVDHKADDEVLEAIANAEARGWTLTVQWNGTPTAQTAATYGLRKPPIYARVSEKENGERYLDWGHYVTDPSGYEQFRSVEAAREYFGLPDEESFS